MANAPIPNLTAPIAAVLINPATGGQHRALGADVASPVTVDVPNLTAPLAVTLFDTGSQSLYLAFA